MNCQRCNSSKVAILQGKCSGLFNMEYGGTNIEGDIPYNIGIGGGDYIGFKYCVDCGQIQDKFPIPEKIMGKTF